MYETHNRRLDIPLHNISKRYIANSLTNISIAMINMDENILHPNFHC